MSKSVPEVKEIGKFQKQIMDLKLEAMDNPNHELGRLHTLELLIAEARRDFGLDKPLIWDKEYMEKRLATDKTLTSLEESFLKISIKLIEWFGNV